MGMYYLLKANLPFTISRSNVLENKIPNCCDSVCEKQTMPSTLLGEGFRAVKCGKIDTETRIEKMKDGDVMLEL